MNDTTFTAEDFTPLERGDHQARFDRLEEPEEPGKYGLFLNWFFVVTTEEGTVEVMGRSSKPEYFTRATKARQWYEAILGRELAKGESADPASLRGTLVMLTLDIVETERGDERNRIVNIRRAETDEGPSPAIEKPSPDVDPEFEAYKAEQAAKNAAADAEETPAPSEPSEEAA